MAAVPTTLVASPVLRGRSHAPGWIASPAYDQWFLFGAWLVPLALVAIAKWFGFVLAVALFRLLDRSHITATAPLTLFDRRAMRDDGRFYLAGLAVLVTIGLLAAAGGPLTMRMFDSVFIYWGAFHIVRQHYGFLRLYQARTPPLHPLEARAEVLCLYSGTLAAFLWALRAGGPPRSHLFYLTVPLPFAWAAIAVFVASAILVVYFAYRRWRAGKAFAGARLLHLGLAVSNWWLGLAVFDIEVGALFITSYHDLQYHAIVRHVARRRYRADPGEGGRLGKLISGEAALGYVGFVLVTGFAIAAFGGEITYGPVHRLYAGHAVLLRYLGGVLGAIVYAHYLFDGKMWLLRKNPQLRADLELGRPRES